MQRPVPVSVEPVFNQFVLEYGGQLVSTMIAKNIGKENADYFFPHPQVIAELKCFQKDLFNTAEDIPRLFEYFKEWKRKNLIQEGDEIKIAFGTKALPTECSKDLMEAAVKKIDRIIHKANKQIAETKKLIDKPHAKGVLLLCNDGNYFLQNDRFISLICQVMQRKYMNSAIDGIVFFTWSQVSRMPDSDLDHIFWIPMYGEEVDTTLVNFVDTLGAAYYEYYAKVTGVSTSKIIRTDNLEEGAKIIGKMKHLPKKEANKDSKSKSNRQ